MGADIWKIKKIRRGWIVVNRRTGSHAHLRSKYGCHCIILFIEKNIIPDDEYLRESYRRLTEEKLKKKDKYYNNPKRS